MPRPRHVASTLARLAAPLAAVALAAPALADVPDPAPPTRPTATRPAEEAGPPRYRLEPGTALAFESDFEQRYDGGTLASHQATTLWPVRRDADGSVLALVRTATRTRQTRDGDPAGAADGGAAEPDVTVAYCTIAPDGTVADNPTTRFGGDPSGFFPRLPATAAEARDGWRWPGDFDGTVTATPLPDDPAAPGAFRFETATAGPLKDVYGIETRTVSRFDPGRGLVARSDGTVKQTYGFVGEGTTTSRLVSVEPLPPDRAAALGREGPIAADALGRYHAAVRSAARGADDADPKPALDAARRALASARAEVADPVAVAAIEPALAGHDARAASIAEDARERAEQIGRPAADWDVEDLAGRRHALADYRGRVVVLDFWYRGCGWCIRAMPQIERVSNDFAGRPVAVLGMNTDADPADARFVRDAMGLTYPVLRAEAVAERYGVTGFPTVLVIDPQGVVRGIHEGWSPDLHEALSAQIRDLLPPTLP